MPAWSGWTILIWNVMGLIMQRVFECFSWHNGKEQQHTHAKTKKKWWYVKSFALCDPIWSAQEYMVHAIHSRTNAFAIMLMRLNFVVFVRCKKMSCLWSLLFSVQPLLSVNHYELLCSPCDDDDDGYDLTIFNWDKSQISYKNTGTKSAPPHFLIEVFLCSFKFSNLNL